MANNCPSCEFPISSPANPAHTCGRDFATAPAVVRCEIATVAFEAEMRDPLVFGYTCTEPACRVAAATITHGGHEVQPRAPTSARRTNRWPVRMLPTTCSIVCVPG